MEKPFKGRAIIKDVFNGVEVAIPVQRDWKAIIFGIVSIGTLAFPGSFIIKEMYQALVNNTSHQFWLALAGLIIVLLIAAFHARLLAWILFGEEVLTFNPYQITLYKRGLFLATPQHYALQHVKRLRIHEEDDPFFNLWGSLKMSFEGYSRHGTFSFDYGLKTVKFGSGIYEAEAVFIFELLKSKGLLSKENLLK